MGNFNIILEIGDESNEIFAKKHINFRAFVILVFDVTNKDSLKILDYYIAEFYHKNMNPNKLLYIVGNKCDKEERQVSYEEA